MSLAARRLSHTGVILFLLQGSSTFLEGLMDNVLDVTKVSSHMRCVYHGCFRLLNIYVRVCVFFFFSLLL